ncbi:MFS transporter [Streptomyces mashuensis]|uniref:MFS transporter n=1 Tax=Streptomyces mashuensis TaxID=33904 RepID=A0A919B6M4_9ACTN|nr:MFS transporter [Streptomyces mashuensis]GHF59158.1 MFS transporter [Streptomyces mashuensis]
MPLTRRATAPAGRSPLRRTAPARPGRARFRGAAYALLVLLTGTNLPTPLYRGYQAAFGISPLVVTLVFAVYVAALVPSLLLAGSLSDAVGRRAVLLPAVVLAAAGALVFAFASGPGWLFAARALQGLALGAASGPLTAALAELEPTGDRRRAALVATVTSVGGLGLGPVAGGALAQYAPAPRVLPFALEILLLVPAAAAVLALPAAESRSPWRPRRPGIPRDLRPVFATSGTAAFLAFAVTGLSLALAPAYVATLSGSGNLLLGGAVVALMLACSAVAQLAGYGRAARRLQLTGLPLLAAGLVLLALAGSLASLTLLLLAIATVGTGQGLAFLGGLTAVSQAAPADRHADVLSTFYVIVYLGVGLPVTGVGFLATISGLLTAVQVFAWVIAALCLVVLLVLTRRGTRTPPGRSR